MKNWIFVFLKKIRNGILWFLQGVVLHFLSFLTLFILLFSCMGLGYFLGLFLGVYGSYDFTREWAKIYGYTLLVSVFLCPLLFFYVIPKLNIKWKRDLGNINPESFIAYCNAKNRDKIINNDIAYVDIALKRKNALKSILECFLLKMPIFGSLYIKRLDFKEKMKDTSFAIGYSLKWIKRKVFFGLGLLAFLFFFQMTGIYILLPGSLPDTVFCVIFTLIFLLSAFLPTVYVDFYYLKKLIKKFNEERVL